MIGPSAFFVAAVALLTLGHVEGSVNPLLFWAGMAVIVAAFILMLERAGRVSKALASGREEQTRDSLTGLASDEALSADLATALQSSELAVLFLIDLETPAADDPLTAPVLTPTALREAAAGLTEAAVAVEGRTYWIEAARFAILAETKDGVSETVARTRAALADILGQPPTTAPSPCPHRAPLEEWQATAELRAGAGGQFDPETVELLAVEAELDAAPASSPALPGASRLNA